MKHLKVTNILIALALLLSAIGLSASAPPPAVAQSGQPEISRDTPYVPGEVVVGFDEIVGVRSYSAQAQALAGTVGAQVVDLYGATALLSFNPDADVESLAGQINGQSGVRYAEPNYIQWTPEADPRGGQYSTTEVERTLNLGDGETRQVTLTTQELLAMRTNNSATSVYPSDGFENWGWFNSAAWKIWTEKSVSPVVCVIDTGIDATHPELKGRIQGGGWDFVNDDNNPMDDNGHGTHVAGVISALANNKLKITTYPDWGMAGISNGKVMAVKVLSAQGWGTTFDIAAGIRHCANNTAVKVINMSLGGYGATITQWLALDYAINFKGKLVIAAAGNSSLDMGTTPMFPAGWADPDEWPNNTVVGGAYGTNIAQALLAVGAVTPYDQWIDFDGDGDGGDDVDDDYGNENGGGEECAAWFSNYGTYVEIVAPGVDIYSTLPITAPFYNQYFYGSYQGFDWWNGTSMAAPHVAAAAARVMSLFKTDTAAQIKTRLLNGGDPVYTAEDPTWDDATIGFAAGYNGDAPFCWPDSMTDSVHLNVASAMGRTALTGALSDARTGLPLIGTKIYARNDTTKKLVPGNGLIDSVWSRWWDLLNVPIGEWYEIGYNKPKYTAGTQFVNTSWIYAYDDYRYEVSFDWTAQLAIPEMVPLNYHVVLNWDYVEGQEMDLYVYLPAGAPSAAVSWALEGTLRDWPYARWHREGGPIYDFIPTEAISIRKLNTTNLYYNSVGAYHILVRDWGEESLADLNPIIRLWDGGKVVRILGQGWWDETCTATDTWWHAFVVPPNGALAPLYVDQCSSGSLAPYTGPDPNQGIPGVETRP